MCEERAGSLACYGMATFSARVDKAFLSPALLLLLLIVLFSILRCLFYLIIKKKAGSYVPSTYFACLLCQSLIFIGWISHNSCPFVTQLMAP